jgi:hypothetical protein
MMAPLSRHDDGQATAPGPALAEQAEPAAAPAPAAIWYRRPAVVGLLALAIYVAIWLLTVGRHMVVNLGDAHLNQRSMDPNFYTWSLRWWTYAIGHGLNPLYSHVVRAPQGHSLAWVTTIPPIAIVVAPLTVAAGPVVTFNLLTILALPLSAWAAFVLCRRLTGKFWPALAGGAVFGFSAYEMNHISAGQLNLTYSLLLPLLAYLIVLWREGAIRDRTFVIIAGVTMAVQFYLFLETFADLTALLAVSLAVGIPLAGRARRPEAMRVARYLGYAYAVGFTLALPYLAYALTVREPRLRAASSLYLDLLSLVVPRPERTTSVSWLHDVASGPNHASAAGYVGIPLLLIAVLLAVNGWSSRLVRFLTVMLAFIGVASLGPALYFDGRKVVPFPWGPLWRLPIVRNAYPSRLMLFAYLILAVMAALWLARSASRRWLRVTLALLVGAALLQDASSLDITSQVTTPAFITAGYYRQQVTPGETVVVVSRIGNLGMLWQAQTGFYWRLAGGYINQAITRGSDLPRPIQRLSQPTPARVLSFERYVKQAHIGAILLDSSNAPLWWRMFGRMGLTGYRYGNVIVYRVDGCRSCRPLSWAQIPHSHHASTTAPASSLG